MVFPHSTVLDCLDDMGDHLAEDKQRSSEFQEWDQSQFLNQSTA